MADSGAVWFGYRNRWQVPVCALVMIVPTVILAQILIFKVKRAPLVVNNFWVPCWRGLSPIWLLNYRASALIIMCGLLFVDILKNGAFTKYYQCPFSVVLLYFALATIISARGCWQHFTTSATTDEESYDLLSSKLEECESVTSRGINKSRKQNDEEETEHSTGFLEDLTEVTYMSSAGGAILTGIVFCGLLLLFQFGDNFRLSLFMGLMHTVNGAFLLLDTVLNKLSFPWYRVADFVLWIWLCIISGWALHACGFTWLPDVFLDLSTPWAPLWYFAIALIQVPTCGAYALIVKAKNYGFSALFPGVFVSSSEDDVWRKSNM